MRKILSAALALVCVWFATPSWGANCNLFHLEPQTLNGVTLTMRDDGAYVLNGTATYSTNFLLDSNTLDTGSYTLGVFDRQKLSVGGTNVQIYFPSSQIASPTIDMSTNTLSATFNLRETVTDAVFRIRIQEGVTYDNYVIKPMLVKGATVPTAYTPYNPLCATCNGTVVNYTSATGTVSQSGTPTPDNPIYPTFYTQGDMVLRAVGNYKDSYDATTGKITRRVGVKVLDGTEDWEAGTTSQGGLYFVIPSWDDNTRASSNIGYATIAPFGENGSQGYIHFTITPTKRLALFDTPFSNLAGFKTYLINQYTAGTPVTIYYPLTTEVVEDWIETSYCFNPIKIATTKYNETKFSTLNTALANAISVVDTVVSNTITQAASIATLQAQKQTRPNDIADDNEKCPAGKKCLLVEDASGIPHWYEIVENAWDLPVGYTQLQYIESTGGQYIDTGVKLTSSHNVEIKFNVVNPLHMFLFGGRISNSSEYYGVYLDASTHIQTGFGSVKPTFSVADYSGQDTVYKCDRGTLSWNSNILQVLTEVFGGTYNAYLFGLDERESLHQYTYVGKMYYAKIWDDGTLVRDFVPAKNSSGVVGMYDTVNGVFYENKGTGSFIAGAPVSE